MRRLRDLCIRGGGGTRRSRGPDIRSELKDNQQAMAHGQGCGQTNATEQYEGLVDGSAEKNIILNHDFSKGLQFWHPNSCNAHIASDAGGHYVMVTNRTESWQGLEQDISSNVAVDLDYSLSVLVRVGGDVQETADVQATLRLDYEDAPTEYQFVARVTASKDQWAKLTGSFSLSRHPKRVTFYLEGPPSGMDLHIGSVVVYHPPTSNLKEARVSSDQSENIIQNPNFEDGLNNWSGRGCNIVIQESIDGKVLPLNGKFFASATNRSQSWNGIQQEITGRVQRKTAYEVSAIVRLHGTSSAAIVRATLWVQNSNGREQYIGISNLQASDTEWSQLHGKFLLNGSPSRVVIYLEGPSPGTDILVNSMVVKHAEKVPPLPPPDFEGLRGSMSNQHHSSNIIANYDFSRGLDSWHPNGCHGHVVSEKHGFHEGIAANSGIRYAFISGRTDCWQGLEQDITANVSPGTLYLVSAWVQAGRFHEGFMEVKATLKLEHDDSSTSYLSAGRVSVTASQWTELKGSFSLTLMPKRLVFFLEGPPPGVDLLIHSVTILLSGTRHQIPLSEKNIIKNVDPRKGLGSWYPLGSCTLTVCTGGPQLLPPAARDSLGQQIPVSGQYILTTNRTESWMGPAQDITERLKLHLTYQVSAWVRVGPGANGSHIVNVALGVDGNWVNGGQTEVQSDRWYELAGSFRIDKHPSKVVAYVQGPLPGVDLMVAGLLIFPVERKDRFIHLKEQTEKVRKRDVLLKFTGKHANKLLGVTVNVIQLANSFPFGSCISRSNLDNEEFVDFFLKNFNWAVFGNELKWYHTEPEQGKINYRDSDEMLNFCKKHGIKTRGHCIFWEVIDAVQPWVQSLGITEIMTAVQNRLRSLLLRYKGQFQQYDVNNEMLHGTFYQDRLGRDIRAYMFKAAHELDPSAKLFVNDYHVEDGCDAKSCPEMYIQQILDLQECGAPVHGIGIQGHIRNPVGSIICSAVDKLAILGLPIWFTEVDVSAKNEHVRADDLEVVLREAFAHPAVEGIVLWGFWEMFMSDDHGHLVNAEGDINEAGKRFLELKREWLTNADGEINGDGEFKFRGYHGTYKVEIRTPWKVYSRTVIVEKGVPPQVVEIEL